MNASPIEQAALELHARGANVIPLAPADKTPTTRFKQWTRRAQNADDVSRLFHRHDGGVAALAGIHSSATPDAGYLAYIDCDSARSFDMVGALIRSAYGETLTTRSARGGHYWIRTDEPIKTHTFDGGELRGRGAYVAAPPSLHPSGIRYQFIDADAPILRVNELHGFTFEALPAERLPRLAYRIMANDARTIGQYHSRSEVDRALMLSLVNAGYSFERIASLFASSRHESHLDMSRRDYLKRLEAEYLRAKEYKHAEAFTEAREFIAGVKAYALTAHDITGNIRTRETDRRVLLAHCERAYKAGAMEWHMSRRDIEMDAQVSSRTALASNWRLVKAGMLARSQDSQVSYAAKYTFGMSVRRMHHLHTPAGGVCVSGAFCVTHAVWESLGLGRYTARTFAAIVERPLDESEIAQATGYTPRTVDKHLSILASHELVVIRDGGKWQALPKNLDDVAYFLGVDKVKAHRARRITRERTLHQVSLTKGKREAGNDAHTIERKKRTPPRRLSRAEQLKKLSERRR